MFNFKFNWLLWGMHISDDDDEVDGEVGDDGMVEENGVSHDVTVGVVVWWVRKRNRNRWTFPFRSLRPLHHLTCTHFHRVHLVYPNLRPDRFRRLPPVSVSSVWFDGFGTKL